MITAKLALLALKLLKRTASYTPGYLALKIYPDFLGSLKMPEKVICVTGTNGKTTTSNLLADTLRECGFTVTNNSAGSNVQAGVATALLADSTIWGNPKKQIAVLAKRCASDLLGKRYFKKFGIVFVFNVYTLSPYI